MTEQVEQRICIKFCMKLEHLLWKLLDDSEGHSHGQLVIGSFIMTMCLLLHHVLCSFFCKRTNYPGDSALLLPRLGALWLLAFPKTKITFKREEISDHWWDSGKYHRGSWWWLGELCEVPRCLLWRRLRHIVLCSMFLVSSLINVSVSHRTWLDTFWIDLLLSEKCIVRWFHHEHITEGVHLHKPGWFGLLA